jgi:hypothetical protein
MRNALLILMAVILTGCPGQEEIKPLMKLSGEWNIDHYTKYSDTTGTMVKEFEKENAGKMFFFNNVTKFINDFDVYFDGFSPLQTYCMSFFAGSDPNTYNRASCFWCMDDKKTIQFNNLTGYVNVTVEKEKKHKYTLVYEDVWGTVNVREEFVISLIKN